MHPSAGYVAGFLNDLGGAWTIATIVVLTISVVVRTWTLLAFVSGVLMTLYISTETSAKTKSQCSIVQLRRSRPVSPIAKATEGKLCSISQRIPNQVRTAMETFSEKTVEAYISFWYLGLFPGFSKEDDFILECRNSLNHILNNLYIAVAAKQPVACLNLLVECSADILVTVLDDLRLAYKAREALSNNDPLGIRTFAMQFPETVLSRILDQHEVRQTLTHRASDLVHAFVWKEDLQCKPLEHLLQRLVTTSILESALRALAKRDLINDLICASLSTSATTNTSDRQPCSPLEASSNLAPTATDSGPTGDGDSTTLGAKAALMNAMALVESSDVVEMSDHPPKKSRGRRLSFCTKSTSSIGDFDAEAEAQSIERKRSFLQRTSSLLSRSRSRSMSPVKDGTRLSSKHSRSRSVSPYKKNMSVSNATSQANKSPSLFRAEMIVNDCSDISASTWNHVIAADVVPQYSILISAVEQKGSSFTNVAVGVGIFRSLFDIQRLHDKLKLLAKDDEDSEVYESGSKLASWSHVSHADLELYVAKYLSKVTQSMTLAESQPFREFCRSDLVPRDPIEDPPILTSPLQEPAGSQNDLVSDSFQGTCVQVLKPLKSNETATFKNSIGTNSQGPFNSLVGDTTDEALGVDLSQLDVANLVSHMIEILTTFYALSPRTWTIRRQLLQLLRSLILSRSGAYTRQLVDWLETSVLGLIADPGTVAAMINKCSEYLFAGSSETEKALSEQESDRLAQKAKKVFLESAMPRPIRSLMGAGPTTESLSIVFEALQDPDFSYGLLSFMTSEMLSQLVISD